MGTGRSNITSFKVATQRELVATKTFPHIYRNILNPTGIGDGEIRFNNIDISLATECYVGYIDRFGFAAGDIFSIVSADDLLEFYIDEGRFIDFNVISSIVTPPTGSGGYVTFVLDKITVIGVITNNREGFVNVDLGGNLGSFVELFDDSVNGIDINMPVIGDRYPITGLIVQDSSSAMIPNLGSGQVVVDAGGSGKYFMIFTFTAMLNKAAAIGGELQVNGLAVPNIQFSQSLIAAQTAIIAVSGDFNIIKTDVVRFVLFSDKANVITNIKMPNFKVIRGKE